MWVDYFPKKWLGFRFECLLDVEHEVSVVVEAVRLTFDEFDAVVGALTADWYG